MAEICLECLEKINEKKFRKNEYILSKDLDLCECCGEWKSVVVTTRKNYYMQRLNFITEFFKKRRQD